MAAKKKAPKPAAKPKPKPKPLAETVASRFRDKPKKNKGTRKA